ncbi:MAG TPA: response regulator [Anaerolineae bacterium]|nr:response regulator [Anaerolineae bacterium]HMR65403.1 response regulator [Anaerolineae bacterium]
MPKILIVENEPDLREFLRDELEDANFATTMAANGAEAVVAITDQTFDLVLVDMVMPVLNGIQTIKVLRKMVPSLPIIGLTGFTGQEFIPEASVFGVICYAKPIDIEDLIDQINAILK